MARAIEEKKERKEKGEKTKYGRFSFAFIARAKDEGPRPRSFRIEKF